MFLHRLRPMVGWSAIVLLTLMLLTVAWSIQAANWVEGLDVLTLAVLGAVVAGFALSRLEWMPSVLAHSWAIVLGFVWTVVLGTQVLPLYVDEKLLAGLDFTSRMALVRDTVGFWLVTMRTQGAGQESGFVFVLAASFLLWLLAYISVRFLVKYVSFWGATLPVGVALLANLYYAKTAAPTYLALFLLCALLLAVRTSVTLNEDYWRRAHIPYSPDIGLDFLKDGVVVAVAVLALGWLAPSDVKSRQLSSVVSSVTQSTNDMQGQLNRWFPDLNYPTRGSGGAYTDSMPLTGAISLGVVPIFDVQVDEESAPRYYRMATFDTYDGTGWRRTALDTVAVDSGSAVGNAAAETVPVTQTFQTLQAVTSQLFTAPQPGRFSGPVEATLGPGGRDDVLAVRSAEPIDVGGTYQAISYVSTASQAQLRAAGNGDPAWVTDHYLQLPESPGLDDVAKLAQSVTGSAHNRYDGADALENYLRNLPYDENISTPPEGRDRVAWFLFEEQRGYCDYFSSAFVTMARSVGIPARVAAGYSRGEFNQAAGAYRQHAYDAHSWPEVYFPSYGWIEFEPTGQDPEITRPEAAAGTEADAEPAVPERDDMLPEEDQPPDERPAAAADAGGAAATGGWLWWLAAALAGAVAAVVVARVAWERPLRGLSPTEAAFARVLRVASWAGLRPKTADTPFEYSRLVGDAIPEAREPLDDITRAYVAARFAPRDVPTHEAARMEPAWQRVRRLLLAFGARHGARRLTRRRDRD